MDQLEDTNFDIIVIGTGLIESIAAGYFIKFMTFIYLLMHTRVVYFLLLCLLMLDY